MPRDYQQDIIQYEQELASARQRKDRHAEALAATTEDSDRSLYAFCFDMLGDLYVEQGDLALALDYYQQALKIFIAKKNEQFIGPLNQKIDNLRRKLDDASQGYEP